MQATAATCTSCIKGSREHLGAQKRTADTQSPTTSGQKARRQHETKADAEAGMLSGISRKRSIRSNPCWFTEFCKSQCLSHFAAPFIVVRAKTSVAESCEETITRRQFPPTGTTSTTPREREREREIERERDKLRIASRQQGKLATAKETRTPAQATNKHQAQPESRTVARVHI